jgi:metal-sulfur cluster biosynthetic enzyme
MINQNISTPKKSTVTALSIDPDLFTDLLSTISDPEHPLSLSQLAVVQLPHITVKDDPTLPMSSVLVEITPTIPHCSMATLIGLCIRVRLERALPQRFRVDIRVRPGTHQSESQVPSMKIVIDRR